MIGAILAAGGPTEFAAAYGVSAKALIPVAGRPMVSYVVEALTGAHGISEVVVICGPDGALPETAILGARQVRAEGRHFKDTVAAAAHAAGEGLVCIVTADLPALTAQSVDATINFALDSGADLTYTIVQADVVAQAFPGTVRTTVRLKEGRFTGGNLVVARAQTLLGSLARIEAAFGRRKSIVGLARLLGPAFVWRLLVGRLSVAETAARGATLLNCRVAVHPSPYAEIGFDVDKPSDLELAERLLGDLKRSSEPSVEA